MFLTVSQLVFYFFNIIAPLMTHGANTLAGNESLYGYKTLVSSGGNFEFGFFHIRKSSNRYIGIWYKEIKPLIIVWVANRETPIYSNYLPTLQIIDGNLVLLNDSKTQIWSTNVNHTTSSPASVVLYDDGNLVLRHGSNSSLPVWQSFDHPTDAFLPGMKLGYNKRTNAKQILTSWRNDEDPGLGLFSLEFDQNKRQIVLKWNASVPYWSSGSWNERDKLFVLAPNISLNHTYNFSYVDNENESYFTYSLYNSSIISAFSLTVIGQIGQSSWSDSFQMWDTSWSQPQTYCDVHGLCGPFSVCNEQTICNCLTDFEPRSQSDWNMRVFSGGCVRKTCKIKSPIFETRFLSKEPENSPLSIDEDACRSDCLVSCACLAYTFIYDTCHQWNHEHYYNLSFVPSNDTYLDRNRIVYVKVSSSVRPKNVYSSTVQKNVSSSADQTKVSSYNPGKINTKVLVGGIVSGFLGLVFLSGIGVIFYRKMKRRDPGMLSEEDIKDLDVPFFEFKSIVSATGNFSLANKLGQGGFGPVYKATFPGGAEMAVKRLSSQSGQGLKEFKNEVLLIAKLQHRNLVRLLGYNIKDREMMLLNEYMPNKSLDRYIFDRTLCICLDWALRFDIITGIARGILYLHQDSRLRIIHRDLKASNVLLDEDMNPKISDFGLAKIVFGREKEASTTRVIGTYGYMAPEYALNGLCSVKSDVFSFGVIILEIISGKRNTGYFHNQQSFILVSYAWSLWKEKKPLDLLDQALVESCNTIEVLRCLIVGLLCVQEDPQDRPTMTNVILMLGMDIESLPDPKEPAFISKVRTQSSLLHVSESITNQLTITDLEGR